MQYQLPLPVPLLVLAPSSTKVSWATIGVCPTGPRYFASNVIHMPDAPADERVPLVGGAVKRILSECGCRPATVLIRISTSIVRYANAANIVPYFRAVGATEYEVYLNGLPIKYARAGKMKKISGKEQAKAQFRALVRRDPYVDDELEALITGLDYVKDLMDKSPIHLVPDWRGMNAPPF